MVNNVSTRAGSSETDDGDALLRRLGLERLDRSEADGVRRRGLRGQQYQSCSCEFWQAGRTFVLALVTLIYVAKLLLGRCELALSFRVVRMSFSMSASLRDYGDRSGMLLSCVERYDVNDECESRCKRTHEEIWASREIGPGPSSGLRTEWFSIFRAARQARRTGVGLMCCLDVTFLLLSSRQSLSRLTDLLGRRSRLFQVIQLFLSIVDFLFGNPEVVLWSCRRSESAKLEQRARTQGRTKSGCRVVRSLLRFRKLVFGTSYAFVGLVEPVPRLLDVGVRAAFLAVFEVSTSMRLRETC
jgi:hypothetical protein